MDLSAYIREKACALGFAACGFAKIEPAGQEIAYLDRWIAQGYHAGMKYMENYRELRFDPSGLVEGARSVISVALNYYPANKLPADAPHIAYYAYGKDYHIVLKEKLSRLWEDLSAFLQTAESGWQGTLPEARIFTDSAPVLERYWAWKAGLGWIGKNTNLIIPGKGSFFFLGEIITSLELTYDTPLTDHCGECTRCLDACPTGALERAHRLNANKCISYLTIENRGEIPAEQAKKIGNRLYGCDTCQEVCPWNRFAIPTEEKAFFPSAHLLSLKKEALKSFTKEEYNRIFAKSAVKRAKYEGIMRNIQYLHDKDHENREEC